MVYGLEETDFYNLPLLNRLRSVEELVSELPDYALVVQAHPFRDNMTVHSSDCLFGIEGFNGGTEKIRNDMAKMFASHYSKTITSGSDFHGFNHLAKGGIVTNTYINSTKEFADVLKSGNFEIIENY